MEKITVRSIMCLHSKKGLEKAFYVTTNVEHRKPFSYCFGENNIQQAESVCFHFKKNVVK